MHFGLYLHRKGIISAQQLVAALDAQLQRLVPIGQLALEEGILTARDIFTILRAQHESPRERFGEVAIELGLMSHDELMRLLMLQSNRRDSLADILVRQGVLTDELAAAELAAYRAELFSPARRVTMAVLPPRTSTGHLADGAEVTLAAGA